MYPVRFPGWKLAARAGIPVSITVRVRHDPEAGVFVASSNDLPGLNVEGETLDAIRDEVRGALEVLLELEFHGRVPAQAFPRLQFEDNALCVG
jgi:predicted RNase H-like HicB family nuclease